MKMKSTPSESLVTKKRFPKDGPSNAELLVEGPDDFNLLYHFVEIHKLMGVCTVTEGEGIDDVLNSLHLRLRLGDVERIGIIIDADEAVQSRWESVKSVLVGNGYDANNLQPSLEGNGEIVMQQGLPIVGIWIMPDNLNMGMIENFVETLIPPGDALWPIAISCVEFIPSSFRRFIPAHLTKAQIHTWLAWQEEPGKPIGQAIRKKYFDGKAPAAMAFASWLRLLFTPATA